ncbi:putative quinol monooxygenase [Pseudomonas asplenii]|uniref:putative quinol monooxygenase n=1 Tax=Pseudomonas asplenii TaxID=53407 RepID=UPI00036209B6|nr:antibiotic biosynthesis monooxygenase family protein [Pseudomonas fuscovaginae]
MSVQATNIIRFKAVPGRSDELGQRLGTLVENLRRAPGCVDYVVTCADTPGEWTVTGRWQSPAALQAHFQLPALQGFIDLLGARLACHIDLRH